MNKVMLIGRICNNLKKKYIGDSTVVQVSLAVQRRFKNSKNEYDTDFVGRILRCNQEQQLRKRWC